MTPQNWPFLPGTTSDTLSEKQLSSRKENPSVGVQTRKLSENQMPAAGSREGEGVALLSKVDTI